MVIPERSACVRPLFKIPRSGHTYILQPQSAPSRKVCGLRADCTDWRRAATELATALRTIVHYVN